MTTPIIIISLGCFTLGLVIGLWLMDEMWVTRICEHIDRKLKRRK